MHGPITVFASDSIVVTQSRKPANSQSLQIALDSDVPSAGCGRQKRASLATVAYAIVISLQVLMPFCSAPVMTSCTVSNSGGTDYR